MKKVFLICGIASIFLVLTSPALAQETIPAEENAATYYDKAFELMKDWPSKDAESRAYQIVDKGWKEEDKELEAFLEANREAFEQFRKGVAKEKCQFIAGEITFSTPLPHLGKARNVARLLVLEARLYDRNEHLEKAITNCLDVIKFGHDLSQDRISTSKLVDIAIFNICWPTLKELVHADKLTPALGRRALSRLVELEKNAVPTKEVFCTEAALVKRILKELLAQVRQEAPKKIKFEDYSLRETTEEQLKDIIRPVAHNDKLLDKVVKETHRLIDDPLQAVISHLETGEYTEALAVAESSPVNLRHEEIIADFANVVEGKEKRPEIIAKVVTWSLFHIWPHHLIYFTTAQAKERLFIGVLAVRLYKMKKGHYPERLDDLLPEYLENVPLDPFNLKPLRYRKRQGKWIIYSIGPDCKDDGGVENYTHIQPEEGADLIFEVE